jgi:hypothetical protein
MFFYLGIYHFAPGLREITVYQQNWRRIYFAESCMPNPTKTARALIKHLSRESVQLELN